MQRIKPFDANATGNEREAMILYLIVRFAESTGIVGASSIEDWNESMRRCEYIIEELGGLGHAFQLGIKEDEGVFLRLSDEFLEIIRNGFEGFE